MLRVGLTGGLGSGKSTAAQRFAELGALVFSADEIGRELMQPGEAVYAADCGALRRGGGLTAMDRSTAARWRALHSAEQTKTPDAWRS